MTFNDHSKIKGLHAIFSPSQPSWLNYTDERLASYIVNKNAAAYGTRLHAWAKETIDLGIKQSKSKKTLNLYINDAIGYRMSTEVVLYYSDYFFGTADTICFRDGTLRIHDLKTGEGPVHPEQLLVYAALFCLEYRVKPSEINIELRIYQHDDIDAWSPSPDEIQTIMDIIVHLSKLAENLAKEEV